MFEMQCSNCEGLVKSPLLAEVQVIVCPQCEEIVVVKNVVISSSNISRGLRSSLTNSLFAARDKFRLNKSHNLNVQSKYAIDKRLARLLKRDDFRLKISDNVYVQINFEGNKRLAKLLNISSTGAAIEFVLRGQLPEHNPLPENSSEVHFELLLPGHAESLSFLARVAWCKKPMKNTISPTISMGLQFKEIDEDTRACLWDFIVNAETSDHA